MLRMSLYELNDGFMPRNDRDLVFMVFLLVALIVRSCVDNFDDLSDCITTYYS
uniref:Uncharacterized protein n=1 Tax=Helianthus annuus TaxID=4232 RepID=A0A251TWH9_HELAN